MTSSRGTRAHWLCTSARLGIVWVCASAVAWSGCGPSYRVVSGDLSGPGLVSFVILWGVDPQTPAQPPMRCEELGVVAVPRCGGKCLHYEPLREAAQRLRGNGVVDLRTEGDEEVGTVVRCPLGAVAQEEQGRWTDACVEIVSGAQREMVPINPAFEDGVIRVVSGASGDGVAFWVGDPRGYRADIVPSDAEPTPWTDHSSQDGRVAMVRRDDGYQMSLNITFLEANLEARTRFVKTFQAALNECLEGAPKRPV